MISVTRVVGNLRVPTKRSTDILHQSKGITLIESTQIRCSQDDQVGEAGLVEQSSAEAKSLKTKGQRTVRLPPQWATTKAARRWARGPK